MIEIRDAKQEDLDFVRQNPIDERVTKNFGGVGLAGWCKTALLNGKILGVGGVVVYWPHVGCGWYCLSKEAANNSVAMVLTIKKMIKLAMEELNLHRLESTIRVDFGKAIKLAEHAGFKLEGLMRQYTEDKKDVWMYAIIR